MTGRVRVESDDVHTQVWHLLSSVVEVFNQQRPAAQLRSVLAAKPLAALATRSRNMCGWYRLATVHVCRPSQVAVEFCATIWVTAAARGRPRAVAVAGRVECGRGGWIGTELRLLTNPPVASVRRQPR